MKHHSSLSFNPVSSFKTSPKKKMKSTCSKDDLFKFSQEQCEFCERLLFCRYDQLVHNATHIIIPLKDEIEKCHQCNQHFATAMDLEIHAKIQHFQVPDILKSLVLNEPIVKCDNSVTKLVTESNEKKLGKILHKQAIVKCDSTVTDLINESNMEKLKDFVINQPVICCEDTIKSLLVENYEIKHNDVNLETDLTHSALEENPIKGFEKHLKVIPGKPRIESNSNIMEQHDIKKNCMDKSPNSSFDPTVTKKIQNQLVFEDDSDFGSDFENDMITTNVNGLIEYLKNESLILDNTPIQKRNIESKSVDPVILDLTLDDSDDDNHDTSTYLEYCEKKITPSVHYDDLIATCRQKCRRCNLTFSNKYDFITHEMELHFKLERANLSRRTQVCMACDKYIVGNYKTLRNHMAAKHPHVTSKHQIQPALKDCKKCNLKYYFYPRHCHNYHEIYKCSICCKWFENESQLSKHVLICTGKETQFPQVIEGRIGIEKTIKVCELCCLFFKNTQIYKYVPIGDYSERGKRIVCERCEKEFFEVKLIKLINKHPIVQPTHEYHKKNLPTTDSNAKRLKKIQKRLKFMNKMSK